VRCAADAGARYTQGVQKALPFLSIYLLVPVLAVSMAFGGLAMGLMPLVLFVGLPLVDAAVGLDTGETATAEESGFVFDGLLRG